MTNFSSSSDAACDSPLSGSFTSGLRMESPSAFTSTSMRPNFCKTESTAARTVSGRVTSATIGSTRRPDAFAISAASGSTYFGVSAFSAMSAPAFASTCAIPFPIPRPAPVMKTTLPVMSYSGGSMSNPPGVGVIPDPRSGSYRESISIRQRQNGFPRTRE